MIKRIIKEVEKFAGKYLPSMKGKCRLDEGEISPFEKYGVDLEIERGR